MALQGFWLPPCLTAKGPGSTSDHSGEETTAPEKFPLAEASGASGLGMFEPRRPPLGTPHGPLFRRRWSEHCTLGKRNPPRSSRTRVPRTPLCFNVPVLRALPSQHYPRVH